MTTTRLLATPQVSGDSAASLYGMSRYFAGFLMEVYATGQFLHVYYWRYRLNYDFIMRCGDFRGRVHVREFDSKFDANGIESEQSWERELKWELLYSNGKEWRSKTHPHRPLVPDSENR